MTERAGPLTNDCGRVSARDRRAFYPWELDADTLKAIETAEIPAEAAAFDYELDISK